MLQQKIMKGLWSLWLHFLMEKKVRVDGSSSNTNNPEAPSKTTVCFVVISRHFSIQNQNGRRCEANTSCM